MDRAAQDVSHGEPHRDVTEHLRSSRANEARLNAAIAELDAGLGTVVSIADLHDRLGRSPELP
jgi:hypothetical protein